MFLSELEPLFLRTPPTLRNSIVRYQSFPFVRKILFKGILCYPSSYEISRECFISRVFCLLSFICRWQRHICADSTYKWPDGMKQNNAESIHFRICFLWLGSVLTSVAWRLESMPQRDLWTATGQIERLMKSGILQRESPILYVCFLGVWGHDVD